MIDDSDLVVKRIFLFACMIMASVLFEYVPSRGREFDEENLGLNNNQISHLER
eukprot:SAG31_NODE_11209_length_1053_cov_1.775681_1_plen_53_part_00